MGFERSNQPGRPLYSNNVIKPLNIYNQVNNFQPSQVTGIYDGNSVFQPSSPTGQYTVSSQFIPGTATGMYGGNVQFDPTQITGIYDGTNNFTPGQVTGVYDAMSGFAPTNVTGVYTGSHGFTQTGVTNVFTGSTNFNKTGVTGIYNGSTNFNPNGPTGKYEGNTNFDPTKTDKYYDWRRADNSLLDSRTAVKYAEGLHSSPLLNRESYGYTRIYGLEEYFTGADVFVFMNDKIVEEIVSISYQQNENVMPVHGYASYTWDAVAYGTRIIQGAITVNYVYDYYLIDMINKAKPPSKAMLGKKVYMSATPEQLKKMNRYDYQHYAEVKAAQIWGEDSSSAVINNYRKPYYDHDYCDVVISYGNEGLPLGECDPTGVSNVDIIKSQISVLNNVRITGVQKNYAPSGDVLTETYTFIAQDMNNTIGQRK